MTDECPVCGHDLRSTLPDLEINDCSTEEKFECPYCESKLVAGIEISYWVKADGCLVCPKCGRKDFDDKFEYDLHLELGERSGTCKPTVQIISKQEGKTDE